MNVLTKKAEGSESLSKDRVEKHRKRRGWIKVREQTGEERRKGGKEERRRSRGVGARRQ